MASCAIPGWYQPVAIGDHRYIDGGTWSSTNIDLMAGLGLDEVYVLAPQASFDLDAPKELVTRLERQWRARVTAKALRELAVVHAEGTEVTIIGPGREDLEAIGGNLMDVGRRPRVMETSLRTSLAALADPGPAPGAPDLSELGGGRRAAGGRAGRGRRRRDRRDRRARPGKGDRPCRRRIYRPLTVEELRRLGADGYLAPAPFTAYAVTDDLRRRAPGRPTRRSWSTSRSPTPAASAAPRARSRCGSSRPPTSTRTSVRAARRRPARVRR